VRKLVIIPAVLLLAVLIVFFLAVPALVDGHLNQTRQGGPYPVSARARALHARLLVADLHADSLVWGRDLLARGTRGHLDVPRLIEGGVALQVFDVFTKTPWNLNIERNEDKGDAVTLLALTQGWAPKTWTSLKERAVYQARRLHRMAALSGGRLRVVKRGADLASYLERRARDPGIVAGLLALEGGQVLEGDVRNVAVMDQAGYRMIGLAHFFDNEVAGSAHGVGKGGLTPLGREVVGRMEERKILVDLAHASAQTIDDVLALATRPVVDSHTGVKGTCDNNRNLSDEQLRRIAGTGGVVGIGFWPTAVCGDDVHAIARAIRHAVDVAGVDHVGLGSDFDGAVTTPFDAAGLPLVTDALLSEGFGEDQIARIMGGNVLRVLQQTLP
jgi:membrane dipeptidase